MLDLVSEGKLSLREILGSAKGKLRIHVIAEIDAELLLAHLLGITRMQLHGTVPLLEGDALKQVADELDELIARRISGFPTQYLIGEAPFRHLLLDVGPGVLIPRPETEGLVSLALEKISRRFPASSREGKKAPNERLSVVDLGSGSGCIAIAIATEGRNLGLLLSVIAVEPSNEAHPYLEKNIAKHDVDVRVIKEGVETALVNVKADVVVANPPYIADHLAMSGDLPRELAAEPSLALFGGASGTEIPKLFIDAAARILKSGGDFLMEHEESQRDELMAYLSRDFIEVGCEDDLNGKHRYIFATRG